MPEVESSPDPKPAPRLGSYLLVQALGSGGMSNVFRAVHEETGSVVAVKVLPRTLAKNVTLLQRFVREAKSAESLDHPNIVAIYDRGFDQGRHYLVLEYVEGRDLHDRVRLNGPLAPVESVAFIREVAEGLRYAAGQGMIHRDVKPANLLMTPDGHAKIIDLGLALQISDEDERVTRDGTTVGTVDYMAPEQARDSRQTSERSDIYSLGCTFYYLLTGSPPFPGGGLSDKLARHYKAPIPDVREHRPDVPESLALLIKRMMEKKPERRYADYTLLIEALDTLDDHPTQEAPAERLDALFADDEDDEIDVIGLAPTEPSMSRRKDDRPPSTDREPPLMAEIVDDDEDDEPLLPAPGPRPRGGKTKEAPGRREPVAPAEISLADLAGLDSDDSPPARRPTRPASSTSNPSLSGTRAAPPAQPAPLSAIIDDEDQDEDEEVYGSGGPVRRGGDEVPLKTWIAAGVGVGLSIAVVAFGAKLVLDMAKTPKAPEVAERPVEAEPEAEGSNIPAPVPRADRPTRPVPILRKKDPVVVAPPPVVAAPVVVAPVEEKSFPPEWEAKFGPPAPSPGRANEFADRPKIAVRRVNLAGNEPQTSSLAAAFSRTGDVVEFADSGPFFEDDFLVAGKSRLIRARDGHRPMIKVEFTENAIIKQQAAKFVLGGAKVDHLVLEGLDLVVDVRDLPDHQTTLFLCQGVDLTLRDCSVTILNANDAKRTNRFSVFRVEEGPKPNRIVLDRTTIRGPARTVVDVAASKVEVVFDRSMILGDSAPLIALEASDRPGRSFHFRRSLLAARGHLMEVNGKSSPPVVRALGTTFARFDAGAGPSASLFAIKAPFAGEASTALDWSGEDNEFVGWPGWLSSGPEGSIRVAGLANVQVAWAGSDSSSRESSNPWPSATRPDESIPADFAALAPPLAGTLPKVASPHPRLRDLTVGSLARLATPELSTTLIASAGYGAVRPGFSPPVAMPRAAVVVMPPPEPNAKGPRLKNPQAATKGASSQPPGPLNLTFNVQESPWLGDLGLYLAEKLVPGTPQATIQVRGGGVHPMTPIKLPDGLSLAILGDAIEGSLLPMATFVPKPAALGRSMFELHKGDLTLANLSFSTEGATRPRHWVLSEDGILAIQHCRFRDPAPSNNSSGASTDVGPVVAFVAKGVTPIPPRVGPLVRATDRPTARLKNCLIWTAGEAISAEVGRGAVDLENCLVISGGPAFTLLPSDVPRDQFEADLVLDRCTVAVDRSNLVFGPMAGDPKGPGRPWLVSTRRCAFPRTQVGGAGALLQVDADAMARTAMFWQSTSDAYEVAHFLAASGPQPANLPSADLKKQWLDLWGSEHTKGDQGPNPRRNESVLRYKDREKPKPGKVVPSALELDGPQRDVVGVVFKDLPSASTRSPSPGDAQGGRSPMGPGLERP